MPKSLCLGLTLALTLSLPVLAAPDQVWQDVPEQAKLAIALDWAPGQWDLLMRQPRIQKLFQEGLKELVTAQDFGWDWEKDVLPHLGSQVAVAADFSSEENPWLSISLMLKNPAPFQDYLDKQAEAEEIESHILASGETVFVLTRDADMGTFSAELVVAAIVQGRLRIVVAQGLEQVENLLKSPGLWPKVQARVQAHPQQGLWFFGEPHHFNRLSGLLFGAATEKEPPMNFPSLMGMGVDARGLYGQAWQQDLPVLGKALDLNALAPMVSADSFFFQAFTLKTPLIESLKTLTEQVGASVFQAEFERWEQALLKHTDIAWPQFWAGLNGQLAWSAALSPDSKDRTPTLQTYLGLQQPAQSFQALKAMRLNPQPFGELFAGPYVKRAQSSSVKANAHTLQTMVETFGVDHGGLYPEDMTSLLKAAKGENAYWKDVTNPLTQQSGIGKALDSFSNFKRQGFPVSAAGQVFYEPLGKRQSLDPKNPKLGGYPGYRVYAYLSEGEVAVLTNDDIWELKEPLTLKPWPETPDQGWRMTWQPDAAHSPLLQLTYSLRNEKLPLWLAENQGFLRLSTRPEPLLTKPAASLLQAPEFQAARLQSAPRQVVYLQIPKLLNLGAQVDEDIPAALPNCVQHVEHFVLEESATPEGSELHFRLQADMNKLDIGAMERCFEQDAQKQKQANQHEYHLVMLKMNRNLLKTTLLLAQAEDESFPPNLEALAKSSAGELLTSFDFKNPVTEVSGLGVRGSLVDYADFAAAGPGTLPGMIIYQPLLTAGKVMGYKLYMTDAHGQLILNEKGDPDVLSPESD